MKKLLIFLCVFSLFTACNNPPQEQPKPKETPKAVQKEVQQENVVPAEEEIKEEVKQEDVTTEKEENKVVSSAPLQYDNFGTYTRGESLCIAIDTNDLQKVKELIESGVNVDNRGVSRIGTYQEQCGVEYDKKEVKDCYFLPLSFAIMRGNLDIVKELIKAGADVNGETECGAYYGEYADADYTFGPLYIAMKGVNHDRKEMNKDIVKELIKAGANVNASVKDETGKHTLLELTNDAEISKILLEHGAKDSLLAAINREDLNSFNSLLETSTLEDKNRALAKTVALNDITLTQELINAGADVNVGINNNPYPNEGCATITPLSIALDKNYKEMADLLESKGAKELLCTAIESKDKQRVQQSIKDGEDLNRKYLYCVPRDSYYNAELIRWNNNTSLAICPYSYFFAPIYQMIRAGNIELIKEIIKLNANIDINEALRFAAHTANLEAVKYFVKKGADVNARNDKGKTPLFYTRNKEILEFLISKGADVNARDNENKTPLFKCENDTEVAELLISKGADINAEDDCKETPLSAALEGSGKFHYPEVAKLLISKGANVNYKTFSDKNCLYSGETSLTTIVGMGDIEIVKLLLEKGADPNEKNSRGETPLFIVTATVWNTEIAKLLISNGADVNVRVKPWSNRTPLFGANKELTELLISNGAEINIMDSCGETPLTIAIKSNRNDVAKLLISKGADVNYPTDFNFDKSNCNYHEKGQTPLTTAMKSGNKEMVEFLISNGADLPVYK